MKKTHTTQTGFTLIELMIVVAVLGVLAAVAIVSYSKYFQRARASEATSILADIRIKQESYRATFRQYFDDGEWQPDDAPSSVGKAWPSPNPWAQLGVRPDTGLTYSYLIEAGAPGVAPEAPFDTQGIDYTNDFWYAARAVEDNNGDGKCTGFEIYHGKADIAELSGDIAGNCP
ncbi:MAG: prepilin-type N-terminal cleavage/methylation domain-containing protein [Deltaproteobacteria bacterium]|nr:prepilin-type N-terminal cleavage/methylation domain-containing protein [Deltaproteobacteria bacterium]